MNKKIIMVKKTYKNISSSSQVIEEIEDKKVDLAIIIKHFSITIQTNIKVETKEIIKSNILEVKIILNLKREEEGIEDKSMIIIILRIILNKLQNNYN